MANNTPDWFIGERVRALAMMHLTRRTNLHVMETIDAQGKAPALAVDILDPDKPGFRRFGVYLHGTKAAINELQADNVLKCVFQKFRRYGDVPFPYCLFYFTMEDN